MVNEFGRAVLEKVYPSGRVDLSFNIAGGNKQIFEFIGEYAGASMYKMFLQNDLSKVQNTILQCDFNRGQWFSFSADIPRKNGKDDSVFVKLRRCIDQEYYDIDIIPCEVAVDMINTLTSELNYARDYMTMEQKMLFNYDCSTDDFKIFWINHEQIVDVTDRKLSEWKELLIDKKYIQDDEKLSLDALCNSMRKGKNNGSYVLKTSIFNKGEHYDPIRFNFVPRIYDGKKIIIGVCYIINEVNNSPIDNYIEDSYVDSLTRLLNKKTITYFAQKAIAKADSKIALAIMDIDNFKNVNDTYGHMFGDKVIKAVADVVKKAIGNNGLAGRIGGDEFMIIFNDYDGEYDIRNILRSIKTNVHALFQGQMGDDKLSCSVGVSRCGIDSRDYNELFQIADRALYIAKQKGKNRYIIYIPEKHGDYIKKSEGNDMVEMRDNYYNDKDIYYLGEKLKELILKGDCVMDELFSKAVDILMVDRISLYWNDGTNCRKYEKKAEVAQEIEDTLENIIGVESYINLFEDDLLAMSNVNRIEYLIPQAHAILTKSGAMSVMQYLLRDEKGTVCGIMSADFCCAACAHPKVATRIFRSMGQMIDAYLNRL